MEQCPECGGTKWTYIGHIKGDFMYGCDTAAVYMCCNSYNIPIIARRVFYTAEYIDTLNVVK